MTACLGVLQQSSDAVVVLGDFNAKDDKVARLCVEDDLGEARYFGCTWGKPSNRSNADHPYRGSGFRYDRVLFSGEVWVDAHVIADNKIAVGGVKFYGSD